MTPIRRFRPPSHHVAVVARPEDVGVARLRFSDSSR